MSRKQILLFGDKNKLGSVQKRVYFLERNLASETYCPCLATIKKVLLYFPTQIRFPVGGKCVRCGESNLTNFLGKQRLQHSTRP